MVCIASKKLAGLEFGRTVETKVKIEETVPLNAVRGRTTQDSHRSSWHRLMRGTAIIILFVILAGLLTLLKDLSNPHHFYLSEDTRISYFHNWFVNAVSNITIATHLRELTRSQHVAGTPQGMQTAEYVQKCFQQYGLKAHSVDYKVLLSYPVSRSLSLSSPTTGLQQQQESLLLQDTRHQKLMIGPFHAYSPSGTVVGEVVYVNYGLEEDYRRLAQMGLNASGAIVIARYGDVYRGTVVRIAAKYGAVAVLMYSDPQQFGGNGAQDSFPKTKYMPRDGVQFGTVREGMGDPSTPESGVADRFPSIPSMPISANEAQPILMSLSGPTVPADWRGSLNFCGLGRGPGILNFSYVENQTMSTIRNVFAVIQGYEEPDRFVVLGNHRDAWTYGAVDPNSGTAALLEIAWNFGALLHKGWQPRRSIVIGSWDAEEYGMIGSTEWVEQNLGNLGAKAVAYLNVDCAVQGPGFFAAATPQLDDLLIQVTKQVRDPDSKYNTVYESWASRGTTRTKVEIGRLGGGGSDFVAFLQHAGVPSIDMYFGESYPVYHTIDDCFEWMKKFGDPSFHRHVAVSTIWGLLALRLVDDHILPFNYLAYANELQRYTKAIQEKIDGSKGITIEPITLAIKKFGDVATNATQEAKILRKHKKEDAQLILRRRAFNDRLMLTERSFLDSQGLTGRPWFKHLVYAPSQNNKYSFESFPGVLDAMENRGKSNEHGDKDVQHEIRRVARRIIQATMSLDGNLT
ncbi:probable glutamate carboxypeptidase LAMP1 [Cryptomeria japonica]|uniref:probable glutamate carboxypeptidase LAMP1 n=1 Tax=Cryptomeria japonica TaxID=3369 RepID=UPI0027DA4EDE|nr:probable glutamate carboxypeptidase LAMP1 [Cryptomeria japonica]